jgi:23S rRNA pseudouridine2605 synthase
MNTSNKRNFSDNKRTRNKREDSRPEREKKSYGADKSNKLVRVIKKRFESQGEEGDSKPGKRFITDFSKKDGTSSRFTKRDGETRYKSKSKSFSEYRERRPAASKFKDFPNDTEQKNKRSNFSETRERRPASPGYSSRSNSEGYKPKSRDYKESTDSQPSTSKFSKKPIVKISAKKKSDDGLVRLNKIIASSGICSRREADDMIVAGLVSVNGKVITELGTKVSLEDDIRYNGERLRQERLVYLLLNKPKDYVTTLRDPFAKRTVLELIKGACKERVFPVGRLDRNTTGVLLLTNDGELTKKLTHPSHKRKKIYHVHIDSNLKQPDLEAIRNGIELEDGFIKADEISFVDPVDKKQVGIEIHSGQNRVVRRIFEKLNYKVMKLDRVYFCGLTKKGLQRGQWRFLTNQEIGMLKMGSYE